MKAVTDKLGIYPAMTFQEIGDVMGISRARVEQIYRQAIRKMRRATRKQEIRGLFDEVENRREYAATQVQADRHRTGRSTEVGNMIHEIRVAEERG